MSGRWATAGVLTLAAGMAWAQGNWELDRQGDQVTVYTKTVSGFSLKAFKAVTKVNVSMDAVLALIDDAEVFPQWYADCSENRIIKKVSGKEFYSYFVNDSPFPVSDRDSVMHTFILQDETTRAVTVAMKGEPKLIPEKEGRVRVPKVEGHWLLTPISPTETEVVLEMMSDAGGSIPAFVANAQVTVGPHKTLVNLRKIVQRPRYKNATVNYATADVTFGK